VALPIDPRYVAGLLPDLTAENVARTIAIDFDGVCHSYEKGWQDGEIYGTPVPGALEGISRLRAKGFWVIIATAYSRDPQEVYKWMLNHGIYVDAVTVLKPPAIAYIDDRAIRFTNWPDVVKYFG